VYRLNVVIFEGKGLNKSFIEYGEDTGVSTLAISKYNYKAG